MNREDLEEKLSHIADWQEWYDIEKSLFKLEEWKETDVETMEVRGSGRRLFWTVMNGCRLWTLMMITGKFYNEIASWYDFEKLESKALQKIYQGRRSTENSADFVLDIRETLM